MYPVTLARPIEPMAGAVPGTVKMPQFHNCSQQHGGRARDAGRTLLRVARGNDSVMRAGPATRPFPTMRLSRLALAAVAAATLAAPLAALANDRAAKLYEDALKRYERNDTPGAVIQLKNALQQDPRMLAAHVLLGKALLAGGDFIGAEEAFAKAIALGVDRTEVALPMAEALLGQGKYQGVIDRFPPPGAPSGARDAALATLRGQAFSGLGDAKSAQQSFEQALAADRRYVPALLALAELALKQGRDKDGAKLAEEAIRIAPEDARLWHFKGNVARSQGDTRAALEGYGKAIALNERLLEPRVARATLLMDLGRTADAAPDVEALARSHAKQPRALYARALFAAKRGDEAATRELLTELTRAIDPAPKDMLRRSAPELLLIGGLAHHGLNQYEKAAVYLTEYVAEDPRHLGARKLLASIRLAQDDPRDAIAILEPARRAAPRDPQVLTLLAAAHTSRREYALASGYLDDALKSSGGAAEVESAFGFNLIASGRTAEGVEHLRRAFQKDPSQSRAGLVLVTTELRRGNAKAAVAIAEQVAQREPKNPVALNLLGQARLAAGDRKGARTSFEAALAAAPDEIAAKVNLARLDAEEKNVERARGRLEAILRDQPQNTVPMYELALVEERAGRTAEAIRWLEKVRAHDRRSVAASARLIDHYIAAKQPEKAVEVVKALETILPDDVEAQMVVGRAQMALGNAPAAKQALGRATRLAGHHTARLTEIAGYQLALADLDAAVYSLDKALAGNADHLPAQVLMAEVELRRRELDKADGRARAIVKRHPQRAVGYRLQADVARERGNKAEALGGYRTAHAKEPSTETAVRYFQAELGYGAAAKAPAILEEWLKKRPDDLVALRALADGYLVSRNLPAARARYEELLRRRGEDPYVLNNFANVLLLQGDRGAVERAQRAHELAPEDASIQDTLGWVLVQQGQVDRGLRHLREARLRDPGNPEIRYHLAAALARSGRAGEARDEIEQALKSDRPFDSLSEARALRSELAKP